ncbi:MAG: CRISPR-associated endonuclease Cas2 [candidate division Zixibacteria bacterium CG_4_9_14_3_um_filter_46_8]|nr:MAG: CRISPR-associated endonuclease Cas2 [candidate division Zixibacteria bacterium CG_4_9_14_3_um_filter_46_8]
MGKRRRPELSEYKGMWLFALFDLPVKTSIDRKNYSRFRTALLKQGFSMLQFSVYARYSGSEERGDSIIQKVKQQLPPYGQVRLMLVTDHQFGKMEVFNGKKKAKTEEPPAQLLLF